MRASWTGSGWTLILRATFSAARGHWARTGQGRQSRRENENVTRPRLLGRIDRLVAPAGQVATPAVQSMVKSATVKVPLPALRPASTTTGATRVMPRSALAVMFSALG